jgi:hypothetical protein
MRTACATKTAAFAWAIEILPRPNHHAEWEHRLMPALLLPARDRQICVPSPVAGVPPFKLAVTDRYRHIPMGPVPEAVGSETAGSNVFGRRHYYSPSTAVRRLSIVTDSDHMASGVIRLRREEAAWRDIIRKYHILIDGKNVGAIAQGETQDFAVGPVSTASS